MTTVQQTSAPRAPVNGVERTGPHFNNVLLVEDEPAHATLISRAIRPIVEDISHVTSGSAALGALETKFYDLVLCDLNLPDMKGIELLRTIYALRPGLPVVVLTSSSKLDDAVSAMREGAWDYLIKEFSDDFRERLSIVIQRVADRRDQLIRESQLRSERRNFWAAVHTAQDGLAIIGAKGLIVFSNEAFRKFCRLAGVEPTPENPLNFVSLLERNDPSAAQSLRTQLAAESQDVLWHTETQVTVNKGKEEHAYHFDLSVSSVRFESLDRQSSEQKEPRVAEIHRYVVWVRDITRRKEQERFQRDLLSTTTHDLKGPLGAILTSAELLSDESFLASGKAPELITRIASCARHSINIIDELLSARRIQDGVLVVRPRWYEVQDILEDIVLDYLPLAKAKSITLTARPPEPELKIFADKLGLTRVLGNLVSNAIKFTPEKGSVEVAAIRAGKAVRISVKDTGPGISAAARHVLFQRYARLEDHASVEGTGLGLFVTKNIVDAHNGSIELQSTVGEGSTFTVIFPDEVPDESERG